ncbi:hypothetical protein JCM11641_008177 [Rhodosporidiobolus odoratus]
MSATLPCSPPLVSREFPTTSSAPPVNAPPMVTKPPRLVATPASPALSDSTAVGSPQLARGGRFSFDALRWSMSRLPQEHEGHHEYERPVGHSARLLFALITGSIPPTSPPKPKKLSLPVFRLRRSLPPTFSDVSLATVADPEVTEVQVTKGMKATKTRLECRPVPNVRPKALKKLKSDLMKADKARIIVADLKRMDGPPDDPASDLSALPSHATTRAYALPSLEDSAPSSTTDASPPSNANPANPPYIVLELPSVTSLTPTSIGAWGGLAGAQTGVFEILADASGALVEKSKVHEGLTVSPPMDRVSVLVWWWGFELALPPPAIKTLSSVASVQQTFFTFLQAFVAAGDTDCTFSAIPSRAGAPELAPLVRYISSYFDMEWSAIKAQDRGKGVVLAATWLLPVALVPRPWDFPVRSS